MSWRWTGGVEDPDESLVEIRLRAVAEGTELTFTHSRLHDEDSRRSHEEGPNGAFREQVSATEPSVATAMWPAGTKPSTSVRLTPRESQRSTSHDHDLRFQMGSGVCPGPGARSARALGAGGSRSALQDAPPRTGRPGQIGLSRAAALRAGSDPRRRRPRAVRIRGHRAAYRRTQRDAPAERRGRARTRDAMAGRGAQFHRAVRHERRADR